MQKPDIRYLIIDLMRIRLQTGRDSVIADHIRRLIELSIKLHTITNIELSERCIHKNKTFLQSSYYTYTVVRI